MSQPRIFVTYAPTLRTARGTDVSGPERSPEHIAGVIALALLAGGGMHATSLGGSFAAPPRPPLVTELSGAGPSALPYLAFVTALPVPDPAVAAAPAPPQLEPTHRKSPRPFPASPRRDLAGFLEDRGLAPVDRDLGAEGTDPALQPFTAPTTSLASEAAISSTVIPEIESVGPSYDPGQAGSRLAGDPAQSANADIPAEVAMQTFPMVTVSGQHLGAVTMRDGKVHLASLVGLLELKLPAGEFERLRDAPAADAFVSIDQLRDAGIQMTIDAESEQLSLSVTP